MPQNVDRYQALTAVQHVLKRTSIYAGDCVTKESEQHVFDGSGIATQTVKTNDGLFKLFQEALDNAVDNTLRDPPTQTIRVRMDATSFEIMNDGCHIPVQQKNGEWIPSSIFFKMFSGSNFDDDAGREGAGVNGVGIKLAAILSTRFQVDCVDPIALLHFTQVCHTNMSTIEEPKIIKVRKKQLKKGFMTTHLKFTPDMTRFEGMDSLTSMIPLVQTRLIQLSATLGGKVKFFMNDQKIEIRSFKQYVGLFPLEKTYFESVSPNFEYGFGLSNKGEFQHQSFANNLFNKDGGTHTTVVSNQICDALVDYMSKKHKKSGASLSRNAIKQKLFVFVNIRLTNPEFRSQVCGFLFVSFVFSFFHIVFVSQAKNYLTNRLSKSDFKVDEKKVVRTAKQCGLMDELEEMLSSKALDALSKSMSGSKKRSVNVDKLIDATLAGTARSDQCSLYLCEGDSARQYYLYPDCSCHSSLL